MHARHCSNVDLMLAHRLRGPKSNQHWANVTLLPRCYDNQLWRRLSHFHDFNSGPTYKQIGPTIS